MNPSLRAFAVLTVVTAVTGAGAWHLLPGDAYRPTRASADPVPTATVQPEFSGPTVLPTESRRPRATPTDRPMATPAPEEEPVLEPGPTILGPGDDGPEVRSLQA